LMKPRGRCPLPPLSGPSKVALLPPSCRTSSRERFLSLSLHSGMPVNIKDNTLPGFVDCDPFPSSSIRVLLSPLPVQTINDGRPAASPAFPLSPHPWIIYSNFPPLPYRNAPFSIIVFFFFGASMARVVPLGNCPSSGSPSSGLFHSQNTSVFSQFAG